MWTALTKFFKRGREVVTIPAEPEIVADRPVSLVLNGFDPNHGRAVKWFKQSHRYGMPYDKLTISDEAAQWAKEANIAYRVEQHKAANFLIEIFFENERDAVLFKLFWL